MPRSKPAAKKNSKTAVEVEVIEGGEVVGDATTTALAQVPEGGSLLAVIAADENLDANQTANSDLMGGEGCCQFRTNHPQGELFQSAVEAKVGRNKPFLYGADLVDEEWPNVMALPDDASMCALMGTQYYAKYPKEGEDGEPVFSLTKFDGADPFLIGVFAVLHPQYGVIPCRARLNGKSQGAAIVRMYAEQRKTNSADWKARNKVASTLEQPLRIVFPMAAIEERKRTKGQGSYASFAFDRTRVVTAEEIVQINEWKANGEVGLREAVEAYNRFLSFVKGERSASSDDE